jgi:hypothetical protein
MTTQRIIFGYNENDTINEHEAAIVRMVFFMYVVCELSHQQIAFHLNQTQVTCPGDSWTDMLVYEILTNPVYIGRGAADILQDVEAWEIAQHSTSSVHSTQS